ncbi:MAG: rRNA maturation RNase YbeY [Thermodesulfovibrionia bacterium]
MNILIKNQQNYRSLNTAKIGKAARNVLSLLQQSEVELSILFVGNKKMKQLNTAFRGIQKTTDVLSFNSEIPVKKLDYPQGNGLQRPVLGDIVISIPKAVSQARISGAGLYGEIYRLLIHGVLHLSGYNHEKSGHRAKVMRKKEQEILSAIKEMG